MYHPGGDGGAVRLPGRGAGDVARGGAVWRLRLHQGVPCGEVLPRCQDRHDLRGDEQHAVEHHREATLAVAPSRHYCVSNDAHSTSTYTTFCTKYCVMQRHTPITSWPSAVFPGPVRIGHRSCSIPIPE